jgi:RHS repeat-associated protein
MTYTLTGTLEKKSVTWMEAQVKKENASGKSYKYYHFACPPERKRRRGLQTANSWTRENITGNNFLANGGTELNTTSNLYDLEYRHYDPILGRMNGVDPMAVKYSSLSPYNYSFNDPVTFNDPSGADPYNQYGGVYYTGGYYSYDDYVPNGNMGEYFYTDTRRVYRGDPWGRHMGSDWTPRNQSHAARAFLPTEYLFILNMYEGSGWLPEWTYTQLEFPDGVVSHPFNVRLTNWVWMGGSDPFSYQQAGHGGPGPRGMTDFTNSNWALTIGGGIFGAMEGATASQGYWLGQNGKYYSERWGGNQYTGSRAGAFKAANTYRLAGRATVAGSVLLGGYMTYEGYVADGGQFGYNAQVAAASSVGSIAGGIAGAKGGALIGGGIGALFGGVGAVPGAIIGGFIGGIGGSLFGGYAGQSAVNYYHDR